MDHSELVAKLAKPGQTIVDEMTANKAHILHMAGCICEEAGEVYGVIKKHVFYNKPVTDEMMDKLINELGDLEFYLEGLRQGIQVRREETIEANINKLVTGENARYKTGSYSDAQANKRADQDDSE